jgi:hypothetical protein
MKDTLSKKERKEGKPNFILVKQQTMLETAAALCAVTQRGL